MMRSWTADAQDAVWVQRVQRMQRMQRVPSDVGIVQFVSPPRAGLIEDTVCETTPVRWYDGTTVVTTILASCHEGDE